MMLVSSEIQRLVARNNSAEFLCQNFRHLRYAGHMGFFKAFGLDFGKSPGEASGGTSYVPMTLLDCDRLRQRAAEDGAHVGDIVESESKHLAAILCTGSTGAVYDTLSYSIREIMRNVVEHSKANQIAFCAQHWPSKQRVEVAVVDRGVGLAATLKRNPHLDIQSDKHAVNYALMPAVSGIAFKGAKRREKSHWANSGFGLYMTSRICRNGGNFFIASGDTGMILTKKSEGKSYFKCSFAGMAVRLILKTDCIAELSESLTRYRHEGYEIQRRYAEIVDIHPSAASLMLSEDFDLSIWEKILNKLGIRK